ncbi:MAG: hypothetical protein IKR41_12635 [Bacteroidales bacterium]|nr:hypothetical protein [Bacteroidales bacterium]
MKQVCEMLGKYIQKYEQLQQKPFVKGEGISSEDVFRGLNEEFAAKN